MLEDAREWTSLSRNDWGKIRRKRDRWYRQVRLVPSLHLTVLATLLAGIGAYFHWWWMIGLVLSLVLWLAERSGETVGYDHGYECGFYDGYQRRLNEQFEKRATASE